jgi:hypothetical protein
MPPIDYMKVLDIAAFTMETASHIEVNALDLKLFSASLSREDGSIIEILLRVNDYDLELSLNKKAFNRKEFQKWLTKFEFQLEQNFFKNISIEQSESKNEYRVKIMF